MLIPTQIRYLQPYLLCPMSLQASELLRLAFEKSLGVPGGVLRVPVKVPRRAAEGAGVPIKVPKRGLYGSFRILGPL